MKSRFSPYQKECIHSFIIEMYLQPVQKPTLSLFRDTRSLKMKLKIHLGIDVKYMHTKVKVKIERTRNVENNDESKQFILRGESNVRCHDRNPSNSKERQQKLTFSKQKRSCMLNLSIYFKFSMFSYYSCVLIENNFRKLPLANFLNYFLKRIRLSIPCRVSPRTFQVVQASGYKQFLL